MSPRPSLAAERTPQILAAAQRVISERGLEGTRLVDVAREAGVSIGTIQHYFHTRDRLLMEAFGYASEQAVERWFRSASNEPYGWPQLLALIDSIVLPERRFRERWSRWLEFYATAAREPELRAGMQDIFARWRALVSRAIDAGVDSGAFHPVSPVEDIVDRMNALLDGLSIQVLLELPGMTAERGRRLLLDELATDLGVAPRASVTPPARSSRAALARGSRSRPRS
jgi:AcrR family transcriptional regulator